MKEKSEHIWLRLMCVYGTALACFLGGLLYWTGKAKGARESQTIQGRGAKAFSSKAPKRPGRKLPPRDLDAKLKSKPNWWGPIPEELKTKALNTAGFSNIAMPDYAGPESCKECHANQYQQWSEHPHRFMNALATPQTLKVQFDGRKESFMGGQVSLFKENDKYMMELTRAGVRRLYSVEQTIGSRFFQYFIGKLNIGIDVDDERLSKENHLLPVGYWINYDQLVPVVHVAGEDTDDNLYDPFAAKQFIRYADGCTGCHTTPTLGDWFLRYADDRSLINIPRHIALDLGGYLKTYHKFSDQTMGKDARTPSKAKLDWSKEFAVKEATETAVNLGISCEACHLGSKEHVDNPKKFPRFFPSSDHVLILDGDETTFLRTAENVNWVCARCHSGSRPRYARGMSTWNSIEYEDAVKGACYTELTCVHCHDPHVSIGQKWPLSPKQDDAKCLECHFNLENPQVVEKHTHHSYESSGSRCMNCHMPKINEGLEHVVRTHTIFSPSEPLMVTSNQPNACNLCHLDKSINWTINHLTEWYGADYPDKYVSLNYKNRDAPVGLEWLKSENQYTRLVGAWSLLQANADWAKDDIFNVLDDPYLLARQFTQKGIKDKWGIDLREVGYNFFMLPTERKKILENIRQTILGGKRQTLDQPGTYQNDANQSDAKL